MKWKSPEGSNNNNYSGEEEATFVYIDFNFADLSSTNLTKSEVFTQVKFEFH